MTLTNLEILKGTCNIIGVLFGVLAGVVIALKYSRYKKRELLLMGIVGILVTEPWWPHSISFLYALVSGSNQGLDPRVFFLLGNLLIPLGIITWLWVFSDLAYRNRRRLILFIGVSYLVTYEIIFFSLLFLRPELIGELEGAVDVRYNYGMIGLLIPGLILMITTGILFSTECFKSDKPEIRLKWKLILLAFSLYIVAATLEIFTSTNVFLIVLSKILLLACATSFYIGFIMPRWMKRFLFREEPAIQEI